MNSDKIQAILNVEPLRNIKKVQSLTRQVTALNRFVSKATDKCLPFFKVLKKAFEWTDECQKAFQDLKTYLMDRRVYKGWSKYGKEDKARPCPDLKEEH